MIFLKVHFSGVAEKVTTNGGHVRTGRALEESLVVISLNVRTQGRVTRQSGPTLGTLPIRETRVVR